MKIAALGRIRGGDLCVPRGKDKRGFIGDDLECVEKLLKKAGLLRVTAVEVGMAVKSEFPEGAPDPGAVGAFAEAEPFQGFFSFAAGGGLHPEPREI